MRPAVFVRLFPGEGGIIRGLLAGPGPFGSSGGTLHVLLHLFEQLQDLQLDLVRRGCIDLMSVGGYITRGCGSL